MGPDNDDEIGTALLSASWKRMSDKNELDKSDDSLSYSESDSDCSGSLIRHRHCPSPMDT
jgi:hypothetical protein